MLIASRDPDGAATALMRQYLDVKSRVPDAIVFFRLGDFYEMFYEDATYASRVLSLTLTTRDKGKEDPVPMCGVPHHAARGYVQKLTELGHRVAICEQLEDPKMVKGIVKRDVVRIITPGVVLDEESLDPRAPSYVAAVSGEARSGFGLAFLDLTTGDFRATSAASTEALIDELARAEPRELIVPEEDPDLARTLRRAYPRVPQSSVRTSDEGQPANFLATTLGADVDSDELARAPQVARAAARVLRYVKATQRDAPLPLHRLTIFHSDSTLVIDEQARAHLELTETMLDHRRTGSLLDVLDCTRSAMGARLLRRWLLFPLMDIATIRRRHDAIELLVANHEVRDAVRAVLGDISDVARLASRAKLGVATPRDLVALGRSLGRVPDLARELGRARGAIAIASDEHALCVGDDLGADLARRIAEALSDDAPGTTKEGGYIRTGVSVELDELRSIAAGGRDHLAAIEARERERTGIETLKVKYSGVFGYTIEVTRSRLGKVPPEYVRKQTVANAERFITPELSDLEHKILTADERRVALELEIFIALRDGIGAAFGRLQALAERVAAADVLAALAELAHRQGYCRPEVDDGSVIDLGDSRHPVVERLVAAGSFVPNDVRVDTDQEQILLVTGPNMAGKSTLIRQVALTVILAQMGSFVPARRARIGICDRVFTRVGAGDNLARGESTFLVEMRETAHILRHATRRSLIVLDEIGRGTSTYDGVSIAWAVAEHLHDRLGARALFATHYHELCALGDLHPRVRNVSVAAHEWQGDIVFLRKLMPGGASRSFGIEVGKLAGLPPEVLARARAILGTLESGRPAPGIPHPVAPGRGVAPQLGLFEPPSSAEALRWKQIADAVAGLDMDELSPRGAWDLLAQLRKELTSELS